MKPRAAGVEDLPLLEKLIDDVFRNSPGDGRTMFLEFPDLFSPDNLENVRIIKDGDQPVSATSYTVRKVALGPAKIRVASLGAVCTHSDYRRRGYSTLLLKDAMENMAGQGVDILVISGDRSMYRNAGSRHCGVTYHFNINEKSENRDESVSLTELSVSDYPSMAKIYGAEDSLFERDFDEFSLLLNSRKFMRKVTDERKILGINYLGQLSAYMCLTVNGGRAFIHDVAGDRSLVVKGCIDAVNRGIVSEIKGRLLPSHMGALKLLEKRGIGYTAGQLNGTFVMMNFEGMMERLKPYFLQFVSRSFLERARFLNTKKGFLIEFDGNRYETCDPEEILNLVFGGKEGKTTGVSPLTEAIFPIPFPDPFSLNYI